MKTVFTFIFLLATIVCSAQGWIQKAPLPENARAGNSHASAIGQKAYLMGGALGARNMEYNYITNLWTQKNNTENQLRSWANAYTVNDTLYFGLGSVAWPTSVASINLFYKYNQAADTFVPAQLFPGCPRWVSTGFTIGNKFYITTGSPTYYSFCSTASISCINDLWSYNTSNSTYTQLASLPFYRQGANAFSINGKGYVVGGLYNGTAYAQLYCYDTLTNTWTAKTDLPESNYSATTFVVNDKAYYITNDTSVSHVYEYNPVTNSWTQLADFPGFGRGLNASAFSIGNKGFVVGGYGNEYPPNDPTNITNRYHKDLWEFNPDCPANILNTFYYMPYEDTFCNYVYIDTLHGDSVSYPNVTYQWYTSTDNINYLPVANGNKHYLTDLSIVQTTYYKRATFCTANCYDTSAPVKIVIVPFDTSFTALPSAMVCPGDTVRLCSVPGQGYKEWFRGNTIIESSPGILNNDDTVAVTQAGSYYFVLQNTSACYDTSAYIVVSHYSPATPAETALTVQPATTLCPGDTAWLCAAPVQSNREWFLNNSGIPDNSDTIGIIADGEYYFVLENAGGCMDTSSRVTISHFTPAIPLITQSGNTLSVPAIYQSYQWYNADQIAQANGNAANFSPVTDGTYFVRVVDNNGCEIASDTFVFESLSSGINTPILKDIVLVSPNPFTDKIVLDFSKEIKGTIQIRNIWGTSVTQQELKGKHQYCETGWLPQGVYFIEISAPGIGSYCLKLIKS